MKSRIPYAKKIILHAPPWDSPTLVEFVEDCIRDGVVLVCVIGPDCSRIDDVIDELAVGDGSDASRFINTTWHENQTLDEVREFAAAWKLDVQSDERVQEVRLPEI